MQKTTPFRQEMKSHYTDLSLTVGFWVVMVARMVRKIFIYFFWRIASHCPLSMNE